MKKRSSNLYETPQRKKNRKEMRQALRNQLLHLSEKEQAELANYEEILKREMLSPLSESDEDQLFDFAQNCLGKTNQILKVYKFIENSPDLKTFVAENRYEHLAKWRNVLKGLSYPTELPISLDKNTKISTSNLYFAAAFYKHYMDDKTTAHENKNHDPALAKFFLDLACENGLFVALVERCNINREKFINTTSSDEDRIEALIQLREDAKQLGNLYGTLGLLHGALIMLDIGNIIANDLDDNTAAMAHSLQIDAAKQCYIAKILSQMSGNNEDLSELKQTYKIICGGRDLDEVYEYRDWDQTQQFFFDHVNTDLTSHSKIMSDAHAQVRDRYLGNRDTKIRSKPDKTT